MSDLSDHLDDALKGTVEAGLHRKLRAVDSPQSVHLVQDQAALLNFSSNDYLGLANHPALREQAAKALERYGTGSGASRLISGSLSIHHELEALLADYKATAAAVSFSSGYTAALGTISALMGKNDVIVVDKLVHACIVDAARLSGARLRVYRHNDLNHLESILHWATHRSPKGNVLIVTESVFSMDGDMAPLRELVQLKARYGAWLMLDEAHGTGVFGQQGSGVAQRDGVGDQIEVQMGTLGKALGSAGGYICGSRQLIEFLVNKARSFIFSTAPVPAASAAAIAGVTLARSTEGEQRRQRLWQNVEQLSGILELSNSQSSVPASPIVPWMVGDERRALILSEQLRSLGIYSPAIRFPSVAHGRARLRFTACADHTEQDLARLQQALAQLYTLDERTGKD